MKSSVINISQRPRRMRGGAAPTRRAAAAPRRGAVRRGGRRETKGVRPINHSYLPGGAAGAGGRKRGPCSGISARITLRKSVQAIGQLSRRSARTFVFSGGAWVGGVPPQPRKSPEIPEGEEGTAGLGCSR